MKWRGPIRDLWRLRKVDSDLILLSRTGLLCRLRFCVCGDSGKIVRIFAKIRHKYPNKPHFLRRKEGSLTSFVCTVHSDAVAWS